MSRLILNMLICVFVQRWGSYEVLLRGEREPGETDRGASVSWTHTALHETTATVETLHANTKCAFKLFVFYLTPLLSHFEIHFAGCLKNQKNKSKHTFKPEMESSSQMHLQGTLRLIKVKNWGELIQYLHVFQF